MMKGSSSPPGLLTARGLFGAFAPACTNGSQPLPETGTAPASCYNASAATRLTPPAGRDLLHSICPTAPPPARMAGRHAAIGIATTAHAIALAPGTRGEHRLDWSDGNDHRASSHDRTRMRHGTEPRKEVPEPWWSRNLIVETGLLSVEMGILDCCGPTDSGGSTVHPVKGSGREPRMVTEGQYTVRRIVCQSRPIRAQVLCTSAPRSANGVSNTRPRPPR